MATRKKLPNLKICVDNTESTDESDVEIQGSDSSSADDNHRFGIGGGKKRSGSEDGEVDEEDVLSIASNGPTERRFLSRTAVRNKKESTYGPKFYENKSGNFVTGVDVTFEEASENWKKRAMKFGTLSTPKQPITDIDIKNLYKSLGMNIERLDEDPRGWRMEAILLRGTDNMSTTDVFDYFSEYAPKGVEWIDDFSCNVVWLDKLTPARALIKLSSSNDEMKTAEKVVDDLMGDKTVEEVGTINADVKDNGKSLEPVPIEVEETAVTENNVPAESITKEPVLNIHEEELMELDYDDNLDLTGDDPIDQALSTWSNFTQNKKQRAERASVTALRKSVDSNETLSAKERLSGKISEKEVDDSSKDDGAKHNFKDKDSKTVHKSLPVDNKKLDKVLESSSLNHKATADSKTHSNYKKEGLKGEKKIKERETPKKMETDGGSESDSSSSSSSSGSSSSGSSNSGSSSGSDSDFGSGSSASSSSSSSSSASSTHSKQKKKKTRSERDQVRAIKKTVKKPEAPPVPPPSREKSEIPWPPGWWRLGQPHPKAEYLFMRYAMKADKKVPGAEKRSKYYQKYGNPNFGGIRGLISNSRKRRLRHSDREEAAEVYSDVPDMFKGDEEEEPITVQSRLSGRLGTRGKANRKSADEEDFEEGEVEEDEEQPVLKEGKDLRDVLNKKVVAVSSVAGQPDDAHQDTDDEMDYGAELERLMGDNPPPIKKRFMRMHADDEEEKIERARRLARIQKETKKWPKHDLDAYQEDEVEEVVEEEKYAPVKKEWVDYDNVEDDDPFNLFGTAKVEAAPPHYALSDNENDDISHKQRHRSHTDNRRDKTLQQRIGSGFDKSRSQRTEAPMGGVDLRAKLEGRRRAGNRNW
ncbi:unnamed protein product [Lymnaea stagnalis]|uniref:Nuclear cap-binding protein subunit 3 n=1 Tax=Lymnaea stagnalis TaxID=6523 RepID=A0AAV2HRP7_LYMST